MTDDLSASGFQDESTFESVSSRFSQMEMLGTHGHNVLARAKRYGRWYLLKGLVPEHSHDEMHREMLTKELDIMMRLQHPSIAQAVGMEEVEPLGRCIVMEWVDGKTLKSWLKDNPTPRERKAVASQLLVALSYIHSHGIAHRDIKPSNIMITTNGQNVKIIDFGLADNDVYAILKQPAGTEQYMAPEQATACRPDARNDIYSLGLVLRDMELGRHYKKPIARCLMPIDDRYQSVEELRDDLQRRASRRRNTAIAAAALGMAAILATTAILAIHFNGNESSKIFVKDNHARQQVDSLRYALSSTTQQMTANQLQNQLSQDSLRRHLGGLNDTITQLNIANTQLRNVQKELDERERKVDEAIDKGLRIIDETNAATHVKEHVDTVSDPKYVWIDWHFQSLQGERKIPEYMNSIRNSFTSKELAQIEYALKEYCSNYESNIRMKLIKVGY